MWNTGKTKTGPMRHVMGWTSVSLLFAAGFATTAQAQSPIQWLASAERGVALAQQSQRPILFYLPGDSDAEGSDLEDAQQITFRNALVQGFVQQYFVPVRLARSNRTKEYLREIGAPSTFGLYLLVVTPQGKLVGAIGPATAGAPEPLLQRLAQLFGEYRQTLFEDELKPLLEAEKRSTADIRRVLERVREFQIVTADAAVAELLGAEDVRGTLQQEMLRTLAALSTQRAVEALVIEADQNSTAREMLSQCNPAGAENMLDLLRDDDGQVRVFVYEAVRQICNLEKGKSRRFWQNAGPEQQEAELEQTKEAVREFAKQWRAARPWY